MIENTEKVKDTQLLSPNVGAFLPFSLGLMVIGWGSIVLLITFTVPTLGMRWLFFFFGVLALTGTAMPIIAFLNKRFPGKPPATVGVIVRQSLWVGAYFPALAWLQIGRVLTTGLAVVIALCIIAIEVALRLRERSQWTPAPLGKEHADG